MEYNGWRVGDASGRTTPVLVSSAMYRRSSLLVFTLLALGLVWLADGTRSAHAQEPPVANVANVAPTPPPGGITQVVAGTGSIEELIAAQPFVVEGVWRLDLATQTFLAYIPGAPDFVNTLSEIDPTDIVFLKSAGYAPSQVAGAPPARYASAAALMESCPSPAEIAAFESDLDIDWSQVDVRPYACVAGRDPDGVPNEHLAFFQSLRLMQFLSFDEPLPFADGSLYAWFKEAVTGVTFRDEGLSACCDSSGRIIVRVGGTIHLSTTAGWYLLEPASRSPEYRVGLMHTIGLLVHEARHAQDGGYRHTCEPGNDPSIEYRGAWWAVLSFYDWLATHASGGILSDDERAGAQASAERTLTRFCDQ